MYFQATDWKGWQFLDLTDNEGAVIAPFYAKGGAWLKYFGRSPSLCARATRMITGSTDSAFSRTNLKPALATTPPSKRESILCTIVPCMTEADRHIPTISFLGNNPSSFCFQDNITFLTAHSTCSYSTFSYCSCPPLLLFFGFSHLSLFKKKSLPQWNKVLATSGITQNTLLTTAFQIATGSLTL